MWRSTCRFNLADLESQTCILIELTFLWISWISLTVYVSTIASSVWSFNTDSICSFKVINVTLLNVCSTNARRHAYGIISLVSYFQTSLLAKSNLFWQHTETKHTPVSYSSFSERCLTIKYVYQKHENALSEDWCILYSFIVPQCSLGPSLKTIQQGLIRFENFIVSWNCISFCLKALFNSGSSITHKYVTTTFLL